VLEVQTTFTEFCIDAQPRLLQAFVARYGHADGAEATAEALAYAWEHWNRVSAMQNPVGYLYRVGQSRVRSIRRPAPLLAELPPGGLAEVEPGLPKALAGLTEKQRVAVTLVHGFGWQLREVAELSNVSVTTVQNHVERGLTKLRRSLGESP
jgi:DNA-directed RNA polymerase specialized sigma24 family protein